MFSVSAINFPALKSDLLQQELFQHIRDLLPPNLSLVEEISTLLRISHDSAYRRIRGEKSITFAELQTLSTHFRISLDSILKIDSRSAVFYGNWLRSRDFNFRAYLGGVLDHLERVNSAVHNMIYFEAKDVLPFEYLNYPELCAFKYFFWIRSVINYPPYEGLAFEDHDLSPVLNELAPRMTDAYYKIPTVQLWNRDIINSTLNQIALYQRTGGFKNPETADILYGQLSQMLEHTANQAAHNKKMKLDGKKNGGGSFDLYFNEAYEGHNTILTEADNLKTVFINHCMLNMMMTHDTDFCDNTQRYFEEALKRSTPISRENSDLLGQFFEGLQDKIRVAQERTKSTMLVTR